MFYTLRPRQHGCHFCKRHLQMHFIKWKLLNFKWNFIEICSLWSNLQQTITGSDNGLSPNRWQAIIWTNDGIVYWLVCVTRPQWVKTDHTYNQHPMDGPLGWVMRGLIFSRINHVTTGRHYASPVHSVRLACRMNIMIYLLCDESCWTIMCIYIYIFNGILYIIKTWNVD